MVLAFGLCLLASEILLPADVGTVDQLIWAEKDLIILDNANVSLWSRDQAGKTTLAYHREGSGPGELKRLSRIGFFDGQFYLCDLVGRKIVVLSRDFSHVRDIMVPVLPRDVFKLEKDLFFVYPDKKTMVHRMDEEYEATLSFGSMIGQEQLFGFEAGRLLTHDGKLIFIHHFMPGIEFYEPDGTLSKRVNLPGESEKPLVSWTPTEQFKFTKRIKDVTIKDSKLLILMHLGAEDAYEIYAYQFNTGKFTDRVRVPSIKFDGSGGSFEVLETETSYALKAYQLP